jgi:hypothetical protein
MIHYKQPITNTKGDALIGYYVKLADTSDNSTITLYADASLTPIVSVSGIDDTALVDSDGMADFWVPSGTYHMDIYATDATSLIRRETDMQFGVPDGDYGDVSVLSDAWTVESVAGTTPSTVGAAVLGAASQAAARTAIGAGTGGGDLLSANNLSDVASAATARTNLGINATNVKLTESLIIACSDETTALTAGTSKTTLRMPYAFTVSAVRASLSTAQATGSIFTVDINEAGTSILSTKLTIDNTEKTSTTAATAAVISDSSIADDAEITVDIDQIGDGTAKGLKVCLIGSRT